MAIDSVRMLTDSAGQLWQRLSSFGTIETLVSSDCFDDWIQYSDRVASLNQIEEQAMRRDYHRLNNLLADIETLVRSRHRALELVRARAAEESCPDNTP
ncbi:MAG: hypothetical protein MI924_12080 [Chloroflexales bacterium]|nr:hypothetical protein [Chloroflexales bacterium]